MKTNRLGKSLVVLWHCGKNQRRFVVCLLLISLQVVMHGCRRSAEADATTPSGSAAPMSTEVDPSRPRHESEITYSIAVSGGGKSSGTDRGVQYNDGKAFRVVEKSVISSGDSNGKLYARIEVEFIAHRLGKDIYRVSYTLPQGGGRRTTSWETEYDGQLLTIISDENCTVTIQPPAFEEHADVENPNVPNGNGEEQQRSSEKTSIKP